MAVSLRGGEGEASTWVRLASQAREGPPGGLETSGRSCRQFFPSRRPGSSLVDGGHGRGSTGGCGTWPSLSRGPALSSQPAEQAGADAAAAPRRSSAGPRACQSLSRRLASRPALKGLGGVLRVLGCASAAYQCPMPLTHVSLLLRLPAGSAGGRSPSRPRGWGPVGQKAPTFSKISSWQPRGPAALVWGSRIRSPGAALPFVPGPLVASATFAATGMYNLERVRHMTSKWACTTLRESVM